jgi:hypothetical protein
MATFRGVIHKSDLEGGIWEIHAADGTRYQLRGGSEGLRKAGQRVRIEGKIDKAGFGIGMTGPILDVKSWQAE